MIQPIQATSGAVRSNPIATTTTMEIVPTEIPLSMRRGWSRAFHTRAAVFLCLTVGLSSVACGPPRPDEERYLERLVEDRDLKDREFAGQNSIVPLDRRSWMVPLRYYEPDVAFRVPAQQLSVGEEQPVFEIPTSTGQLRTVRRVGTLEFVLKGEPMTLAALVELPAQNADNLFVPFRDQTSGDETYPAGRYLDLPNTRTGIYELDFNRAYHPYCYFNEEYECPFPPPENRLATAIRAGERLPPEDERRIPLTQTPSTQDNTETPATTEAVPPTGG